MFRSYTYEKYSITVNVNNDKSAIKLLGGNSATVFRLIPFPRFTATKT